MTSEHFYNDVIYPDLTISQVLSGAWPTDLSVHNLQNNSWHWRPVGDKEGRRVNQWRGERMAGGALEEWKEIPSVNARQDMREAVIHPSSLKFSLKMFSAVAAGYISDSLFPKSFRLPPAPYPPVLPPTYHLSISPLTSLNLIYIPVPLFFHKSSSFYTIT